MELSLPPLLTSSHGLWNKRIIWIPPREFKKSNRCMRGLREKLSKLVPHAKSKPTSIEGK